MTNEVKELEVLEPEEVSEEEGSEIKGPESEGMEEETQKESESSTEEEQEEEPEGGEALAPLQPKPVEGETERERGLRKEIQRLKGQRREAKLEEEKTPIVDERLREFEEDDYTPEEISKMERAIDVLAKKSGYAKKSEVQQNNANDTLNEFLEEHAEYAEDNDVEDVRWNTFERIRKSDYKLQDKTPRQLKAIFGKIHRDVNDELGESELEKSSYNQNKIDAQRQKIQSVSHTGGTKDKIVKKSSGHLSVMDEDTRKMFKGDWSDEDF